MNDLIARKIEEFEVWFVKESENKVVTHYDISEYFKQVLLEVQKETAREMVNSFDEISIPSSFTDPIKKKIQTIKDSNKEYLKAVFKRITGEDYDEARPSYSKTNEGEIIMDNK